MERGEETVLITGATSGIGYELSKIFARNKYRVIIVGPEAATLHNVSEVLKTLGASKVLTICKNLFLDKAADEVYAETRAAGMKVDILVNNIFTGQHGKFAHVDLSKDMEIIYQNVVSVVKLTKFYLKEMVVGDSGQILQLAPLASYESEMKPAVYAATKAFVLSFTESLMRELEDTNVNIQALIPLTSSIEFYKKAGLDKKLILDDPEDPAVMAKIAFDTLSKSRPENHSPNTKQIPGMQSLPKEAGRKPRKRLEAVKKAG